MSGEYESMPCTNETMASGNCGGERVPYALDMHIGDGTWLNVVEEFAELPTTRTVVFSTTEVWRPMGVYAGDAFLGELRLREPRGYDGGLRTAVRVEVSVHVDVDLLCSIGVECSLSERSTTAKHGYAAEKEIGPGTEGAEEGLSVSTAPRGDCPATVSGDVDGGHLPYALDLHTGDGTWLNAIEEFARLPVTRSVIFATTELWRPVGVYAGHEFLGELRLHEPRGYDGGLRTAVEVVVSVHVDQDMICSVVAECWLFGSPAVAEDEFAVVEEEECLPVSTVQREDPSAAISSDDRGGHLPFALRVKTGDDTWLKVVEESAELPAERLVEFTTAEVWKPVGVYAGDALLGELRLREPRGYDGGLRTTVRVVIAMCVDADFHCTIGVECDLLRSPATEDHYGPADVEPEEIVEDDRNVTVGEIESGYRFDNVLPERRENVTAAAVTGVYGGDESRTVTPSTAYCEGGMEYLPMTVECISGPGSQEGMPIVPLRVTEDGDYDAFEHSAEEERPIHSICHLNNVTNLANTAVTGGTIANVTEPTDNEMLEVIVEIITAIVDMIDEMDISKTKEWCTVSESTSIDEYGLENLFTEVEHDSSSASPDGMPITSVSVVDDDDGDVTGILEHSTDEERPICTSFHLNDMTMTLVDTADTDFTVTTVAEYVEGEIPEAIGEDNAGVEVEMRDHESCGEAICDPVIEPIQKKKKKKTFVKRIWSWFKKRF